MTERFVARLVWAVAALAFVAIGLMTWSVYRAGEFGSTALSALAGAALVVALFAFVLSGAMIVSRQPRNVIGWLLIIPGLSIPLTELGTIWLRNLDPAPVRADIWLWLVLWITSWAWVLLIFPVFHLLLTFPNGRLLSPRWRWVVWLEGAMVATMMGLSGLGSELSLMVEEDIVWSVPNPIGLAALTTEFFDEGGAFESVWSISLVLLTLSCLAAVVIRFRRGSSEERVQLKWPLYGVGLFGFVYVSSAIGIGVEDGGVPELLFGLSLAGIPVAVAIAVLRYRLYEIDRIISRTVSYLIVVGLLGAVFFGAVTSLSSVLQAESDLAIAASTLSVAALFNPLRKRVQTWVDRRFNRSRYDAQRVMDRFAGSSQDRVDTQGVVDGWVAVVSETMQPTSVAVWVREVRG